MLWLDSGGVFFRSIALGFRTRAAFATFLWRTAEATFTAFTTRWAAEAFASPFTWAAHATRAAGSARASRTLGAAAHHVAHALHAFAHFVFGDLAILIAVHAAKAGFDFSLGEFGVLLFVHIAVAVLVHAAKDFVQIGTRSPGASRAAWRAALRTVATAGRWGRRLGAAGFGRARGALRRTAEATFTARRTACAWSAAFTATAHAFAHSFRNLGDLRLVHKAVAIGVHTCKALIGIVATAANFAELFLADLAVAISVGSFQIFSDAASAAGAFRRALLGGRQACAKGQQAEALNNQECGFHIVRGLDGA